MNSRERVLAMLEGRTVDRLPCMPITMQFAADRIGRPYRDYATDHRVLVEAQLRVVEEFGIDHVSGISDPTREAEACGAAILYPADSPPAIDESAAALADRGRLAGLKVPDPLAGRMGDRMQAIALFRERVGGEKLIEGWIEGPCAEAADLRGINHLMTDFIDEPEFVRDLFEFVLEMELAFARAQVEAGADIVGIGDAAASLVGPRIYEQLVEPYERRLIDGVKGLGVPARLHICGNTRRVLAGMGRVGAAIVDLDYFSPVAEARAAMGPGQVLLGNIDPVRVLRNGTAEGVAEAIAQCHREAGPRYIVGAGCEVPRDTPVENLAALCGYAREHGA